MADGIATITGTEYAERLWVEGRNNTDSWRNVLVQGLAGDDTIYMMDYYSQIFSGTIDAGDGNDVIKNGYSYDSVRGSFYNFSINGGNGYDYIINGNRKYNRPQFCTVEGGAGNDSISNSA